MIEIKEITKEKVWEIRHIVMWPEKEFDFIKISGDETAIHLGVFAKNQLVSVVSLFIDNNVVQFRKFATLTEKQGLGFGTKLLQFVFEYCQKNNISRIWCNARKNKIGFYNRFGLVETDQEFVKENKEYIIMERVFK